MGHSYHFLCTLDLANPQDPVHAALLVADSSLLMFEDFQKQTIEAIDIEPGAIDILLRGGRRRVLESEKDDCGYSRPLSPPREPQVQSQVYDWGRPIETGRGQREPFGAFRFAQKGLQPASLRVNSPAGISA